MTEATEWSANVNKRFFGLNEKPKENTRVTEFMSGRTVGEQINTRAVMQYSCSLLLAVPDELNNFWAWFNDELGALAGVFTCDAIGDGQYRFVSTPEPQDTSRVWRELSLEIEEVY